MKKFLIALLFSALTATSVAAQGVVPRPSAGSAEVTFSSTTTSGALDTNDESVALALTGFGAAGIRVSGTWTGTLTFEVSADGVGFDTIEALASDSSSAATTTTGNGSFSLSVGGFHTVRIRATAAMTGTADIVITASLTEARKPSGDLTVNDVGVTSIAAGDNNIGNIDVASLPSVTIGTFPDNEPFNVAQLGGSAVGATNPFFVRFTDGSAALTLHSADADTGGGTATRVFMGLFGTASGGPALISATGTALDVQITDSTIAVTQSGSWTVANTGIGETTDAAATVGSTGSVTAKLRLLTTQTDEMSTKLDTIDASLSTLQNTMASILSAMNQDADKEQPSIGSGPELHAELDDVSTDVTGLDEGDAGTLRIDTLRRLRVVGADCADPAAVSSVVISTTSTQSELVSLTSGQIVFVCGFQLTSVADVTAQFVYGTGSACDTGENNLTGAYQLNAASGAGIRGISAPNSGSVQFKGAASNALCLELSSGVQTDGYLTYVKR